MAITVVPAGSEDGPKPNFAPSTPAGGEAPPETPAAPGSPLANLRQIRQAKLNKLHLDLKVPRWDEGDQPLHLVVRYHPVSASQAMNAVEKRQASKAEDWVILAQIDQLVSACVGVYAKVDGQAFTLAADGSGNWVSFDPANPLPGEWVSFSGQRAPELAAALGVDLDHERSKSAALVRALYFTDGDIGLACQRLSVWSAEVSPEADQEALGE